MKTQTVCGIAAALMIAPFVIGYVLINLFLIGYQITGEHALESTQAQLSQEGYLFTIDSHYIKYPPSPDSEQNLFNALTTEASNDAVLSHPLSEEIAWEDEAERTQLVPTIENEMPTLDTLFCWLDSCATLQNFERKVPSFWNFINDSAVSSCLISNALQNMGYYALWKNDPSLFSVQLKRFETAQKLFPHYRMVLSTLIYCHVCRLRDQLFWDAMQKNDSQFLTDTQLKSYLVNLQKEEVEFFHKFPESFQYEPMVTLDLAQNEEELENLILLPFFKPFLFLSARSLAAHDIHYMLKLHYAHHTFFREKLRLGETEFTVDIEEIPLYYIFSRIAFTGYRARWIEIMQQLEHNYFLQIEIGRQLYERKYGKPLEKESDLVPEFISKVHPHIRNPKCPRSETRDRFDTYPKIILKVGE